jgi:hypothetical protein
VPNLPDLAGLSFWVGGITFEAGYPDGVKRWAPPVPVTLLP